MSVLLDKSSGKDHRKYIESVLEQVRSHPGPEEPLRQLLSFVLMLTWVLLTASFPIDVQMEKVITKNKIEKKKDR